MKKKKLHTNTTKNKPNKTLISGVGPFRLPLTTWKTLQGNFIRNLKKNAINIRSTIKIQNFECWYLLLFRWWSDEKWIHYLIWPLGQ